MAEMLNTQKIRAALVFQAVQLGQHLRIALAEAGIEVVAEAQANALLNSGFDDSLDVFVVNLDPELEDHLEEISDLLDRYERPVIFNDGAASSGLAGWDQARWARHLASKIRGELDSHPPRPKDATFIPLHVKPVKAISAANASVRAILSEALSVSTQAISQPILQPNSELAMGDRLSESGQSVATNATIQSAPAAVGNLLDTAEPEVDVGEFDFKDANFAWEELDATSNNATGDLNEKSDMAADFFDMPGFDLTLEPMTDEPDEFESLLRTQQTEKLTVAPVAAPMIAVPAAEVALIKATISERDSVEKPKPAPMDWSLEPFDSDELSVAAAPITGRASYSAKDVVTPNIAAKLGTPAAIASQQPSASSLDALEELSDLDFFTEMDALPPTAALISAQPQSSQSLDQLFADLDDISFDASEPLSSTSNSAEASATSDFVDDFEFDMDLEPTVASPVNTTGVPTREMPVFDLASANRGVENKARGDNASGPSRVYVLGASIGGPEAVKSFLSKLKPSIPAAFILAQHMGAEFLELMAGQLSKSSILPVKLAQEGMPLLDSEVVVVPVNKRFMVNPQGYVEFQEMFDESPYSPSIDQVMTDMSERFGSRCVGIIFSGMASDAIEGSKVIASRGGKIWVQDPATCVISSMIDGAQAAGVVSYVGAPEQLADHVLEDIGVR